RLLRAGDGSHGRGAGMGARGGCVEREGGGAPALGAARHIAGVPAAGAVREWGRRAEESCQGGMARRPAAGSRLGTALRLLLERAAVETAAARRPAPASVRRIRGRAETARFRRGAGARAAWIRASAPR